MNTMHGKFDRGGRAAALAQSNRARIRLHCRELALAVGLAVGSLVWAPVAAASGVTPGQTPTGGRVVGGSGTITQHGVETIINQKSGLLALNWQTFNVGKNASVIFKQPSFSAVALNRILDQNPSKIFGKVSSNGQIFLINTHGIIFGASAQLNVGGLVASTLDLTPNDFLKRHFSLDAHGGHAGVVNHGIIAAASGGSISLIGGHVVNDGLILANYGRINLDGASRAVLDFAGNGLINIEITGKLKQRLDADKAAVVNKGTLQSRSGTVVLKAAAAEKLFTNLVNNAGIIKAGGISSKGGVVRLVGTGGNVVSSGSINVSGTGGGSVRVTSDHDVAVSGNIHADATRDGDGGTIFVKGDDHAEVDGVLTARGGAQGGNGGFIETSGGHVHIGDDTRVNTLAAHGRAGAWLIDPHNFTIATSGGDMTPAVLETNLDTGPVQIKSSTGGSTGAGNINVDSDVTWSQNTLKLTAANDININAVLSATGTASLTLQPATANGTDPAALGGTNIISSTGSLSLAGAGSMTIGSLTNNGTFDISGLGSGLTITSLGGASTGVVKLGGNTLTLSNAAGTFAGAIKGNGGFALTGGHEALAGTNTYTGGTTVGTGAALSVGNGGTSGSIKGNVADGGDLVFDRTDNVTYAGVISGAGQVGKAGAGTLTLTGTNTYTGPTSITAGILQIGDSGNSGSLTGDIIDNAGLIFNRGNPVTYAGAISGTGTVTQAGSDVLTLTGVNTYTGSTTINNGGTLALSGTGSIATSDDLVADGTFDISGSTGTAIQSIDGASTGQVELGTQTLTLSNSSGVFAGVISGTGSLALTGGHEALAGTNTYTGGTTVGTGAALSVGDGGTSGSIKGNVADDGELAFDRTDNVTYAGVISGAGQVVQGGAGTTTLTGANTYTGSTAVNSGILALAGSGSIATSSGVLLASGATFDISGTSGATIQSLSESAAGDTGTVVLGNQVLILSAAAGTFGGLITGNNGGLTINAGTEVLTGTSNTYGGGTTVNSGATLKVSADGNLGGTGGQLTLNGGTLENTASFTLNRSVTVGALGGTFQTDASTNLTVANAITGSGPLIQNGTGTLTLDGDVTTTGATQTYNGTLALGNAVTLTGTTVNLGTVSGNGKGLTVAGDAVLNGVATVPNLVVTGTGNELDFGTAGSVNGSVTAATLDYSHYAAASTFDFADGNGTTTGISGMWSGVTHVTGSAGASNAIIGLGSTTAFNLTGNQAGKAGSISFTGFDSANTTTVTGAIGFDDGAKSNQGMTFASVTQVTGSGTIGDVTGDFDDTTLKSSASGITYTGFGKVAGTSSGSVTAVAGNFDDATGQSAISGITYTGFGKVAGTSSGSVTAVAGNFDDATGQSATSGLIYTGFGKVAGTSSGSVTAVAGSFDDGTGQSAASGFAYTGFGAVDGTGGSVTGVTGNFDVSTNISSASGINYNGFHLATVAASGASAGIIGLGATLFTLTGSQAGSVGAIAFSGFASADTSQIAGAANFDDGAKSSEGMTFVNAAKVAGSGTIGGVTGDFDDATAKSSASGISYTGFGTVAGNGGSVTDVTGSFDDGTGTSAATGIVYTGFGAVTGSGGSVTGVADNFDVVTDVSSASGLNYSGFNLTTVASSGAAATLTGSGDTYTLTGANAGNVNGLNWSGFDNIDDAAGVVDFGAGGSVGGDVTVATLDYGHYGNAVTVNLSGAGSTGVAGRVHDVANVTSLHDVLVTGSSVAALAVTTTGAGATTTLGNLAVNGNLSVDSGGAVAQGNAGPLTVSGTTTINAHANAITLDDAGNNLAGAVSLSNAGNHAVYLDNGGHALTLGTLNTGIGALTLTDYGTTPLLLTQNIATQGGAVTFAGAVTLGSTAIGINTTNGGASLPGANISFGGAIEGATAGASSLDINAGSSGSIAFNGDVGETVALDNLTLMAKSLTGVPAALSVDGDLSIATIDALTTGASWSGANVALSSGSNLILGGDVQATAASGTVSLASGGAISQSAGGIHAYALTGHSAGSTALTGNANVIANLGDFTANGFALIDNSVLAVLANDTVDGSRVVQLQTTGAGNDLTIDGTVSGTTTNLVSASAIDEGANGVVQATTLTGHSVGATDLTGVNEIANLGNFSAAGLTLTNNQTLTVANGATVNGDASTTLTTTGGNSDLTIDGTVSGTTTRLVASDGIGENASGVIIANSLTGNAVATATLTGTNQVANLGSFSANGLTLNDGTALSVATGAIVNGGSATALSVTGPGSDLTINGTLMGTATQLVSAGSIDEGAAGVIQAGTLTGSAAHAAQLTGSNAIAALGNFTAQNLALTNGRALTIANGATVDGGASTMLTTTGANGNLTIDGTLKGAATTLQASATIVEGANGVLSAGTLTGSSVGATSLAGHNNVSKLGNFTAKGFSLATGSDLTVASGNTVAGGINTTLTTTGAGHDVAIDGNVQGDTTKLVAAGAINEGPDGRIVASTLTGRSVGDTALKSANQIAALGTFSAKNFYLTDAHALVVGGSLATTGGAGNISLVTTGGTSNMLTVNQTVHGAAISMTSAGALTVANAITGTKIDLTSNGNLAIKALVDSGAGTVTLTQKGAGGINDDPTGDITAGVLTGSATGATALGSSSQFMDNHVKVLGDFASPAGFSFTNGQTLTLASVNGSAYTVNAGTANVYLGVRDGDILEQGTTWMYNGHGTWSASGHIGLAAAPIYVKGVGNQRVMQIGLPPAYFYAVTASGALLPITGSSGMNVPIAFLIRRLQGINGHYAKYAGISVVTAAYRTYEVVPPGLLLPPDQLLCTPHSTGSNRCPWNASLPLAKN